MAWSQQSLFDETPRVSASRGTTIREINCKTLLNPSLLGAYTINCYSGCANGCVYCYARYMQRFHPHLEPWGAHVDVKVNAPAILRRQLKRTPPGAVFACSACDGWHHLEEQYKLTRRCCALLIDAGFPLSILTKNDLILRDLDLLQGGEVTIGVTITTTDEEEAARWEPGAASVARRVAVLQEAKRAGIDTAVMFGPLLPGISDTPSALTDLFQLAAEMDVGRIWTDRLNPKSNVWPAVRKLLSEHRPDLLQRFYSVMYDHPFRRRYGGDLHRRIRKAAAAAGVLERLDQRSR